jgi:hypothetical protein
VLEFLIDTLEGDRDALADAVVGRLNVRDSATHHQAHQIDGGGEQQFLGVAALGGARKQAVAERRRQGIFNGGPRHHTEGAFVDKLLEHGTQDHGRLRASALPSH